MCRLRHVFQGSARYENLGSAYRYVHIYVSVLECPCTVKNLRWLTSKADLFVDIDKSGYYFRLIDYSLSRPDIASHAFFAMARMKKVVRKSYCVPPRKKLKTNPSRKSAPSLGGVKKINRYPLGTVTARRKTVLLKYEAGSSSDGSEHMSSNELSRI